MDAEHSHAEYTTELAAEFAAAALEAEEGSGPDGLRHARKAAVELLDLLPRVPNLGQEPASVVAAALFEVVAQTAVLRPLRALAYHGLAKLAATGGVDVSCVAARARYALVTEPSCAPVFALVVVELCRQFPQAVAEGGADELLRAAADGLMVASGPPDEAEGEAAGAGPDTLAGCVLVAQSTLDVLPTGGGDAGEAVGLLSDAVTDILSVGAEGGAGEDLRCLLDAAQRALTGDKPPPPPPRESSPISPRAQQTPPPAQGVGRGGGGKTFSQQEVRQFLAERKRQFEAQQAQLQGEVARVKDELDAARAAQSAAELEAERARSQSGAGSPHQSLSIENPLYPQLEAKDLLLAERSVLWQHAEESLRVTQERMEAVEKMRVELRAENAELSAYVMELIQMQEARQ
eukprot:Hpha_TRINITY_DN16765_c0_g6::TRINITY_DN16765_c0_g6_i1::g.80580::m.80580